MNAKLVLWEQMGPLGILSTLSAAVFFTPHANSREFANAFNLHYRYVNFASLYAAFGSLILISAFAGFRLDYKVRLALSTALYLAGTILYCISYWTNGNTKAFFAGQILIDINFCILFVLTL